MRVCCLHSGKYFSIKFDGTCLQYIDQEIKKLHFTTRMFIDGTLQRFAAYCSELHIFRMNEEFLDNSEFNAVKFHTRISKSVISCRRQCAQQVSDLSTASVYNRIVCPRIAGLNNLKTFSMYVLDMHAF